MKYDYLIVGAGFAGSVLADRLANILDKKVLIIDKRNHVGGNCYDYIVKGGVIIQKYGPHIFHTNNEKVYEYLSRFTKWIKYKHKVIAYYKGEYYPIPINIDTINKFYNLKLKNKNELKKFLEKERVHIENIKNSRDVVTSKFGIKLYEAFVKHYTKKQWGKYPEELDKCILERLPLKYNKNPYYFYDKYQGLPKYGFTPIFQQMLSSPNITTRLKTDFFSSNKDIEYNNLIFTGRIDKFFNYRFGRLGYRSIKFIFEEKNKKDYQPNSVVNYPDKNIPYLRTTEFKKFYNTQSSHTVICKEFFTSRGILSYPVIDKKNQTKSERYKEEARSLPNTILAGRLGLYQYLNMDQVIENSLNIFEDIKRREEGR